MRPDFRAGRGPAPRPCGPLLIQVGLALLLLGTGSALASPGTRCLRADAAPRIQAMVGLDGTSAAARMGSVGDIRIERHSTRITLTAVPDCVLVLTPPTSPIDRPLAGTSASFVLSSLHPSPSWMCMHLLREAAALVAALDTRGDIWSPCGSAHGPPPGFRMPPSAAGRADARASLSVFWLMAAGCLFVALAFCASIFGFRNRLHRRASRVLETLGPPPRPLPHKGATGWLVRINPVLAFVVIVVCGWDIGFNNEMTSGIYLHPYRFLSAASGEWAVTPCSDGLFRQEPRPELGICATDRRLPLLNTYYMTTVSYWPFAEIARQIPFFGGDALRLLLLPVAAFIFWILHRILSATMAPPAVILLVPWVVVAFPISGVYTTLYLFEYLPQALLLAAWWLLWRWNVLGGAWRPILAALLLGAAVGQKLTFAVVVLPFALAFGLIYGLRRLSASVLAACAVAACLAPVLLLLANVLADPAMARFLDSPRHPLGLFDGLLSYAHQAFAPSPEPGSRAAALPYLVPLLGLLSYSGWKAWQYLKGTTGSPSPAFLSLVVLVLLPAMALLYRSNPTSSPLLQILPLPAVVMASALADGWTWLGARLGTARRFGLPLLATGLVLWGAQRTWSFQRWLERHPAHLRRTEQLYAAARLEALGAVRPVLVASYYHGVFELLTRGRVRPVYVSELGFDPRKEADWTALLERTRHRAHDFLFTVEPFGVHRRPDRRVPIWETFERAVRSAHRRLDKRVDVRTSDGRPAFILFRLGAGSS